MWVVALFEAGGADGEKGEDGLLLGWDCGSEPEELVDSTCEVLLAP